MVYDSETYELCHKLTFEAEEKYRQILENAATEILLKHMHPISWFIQQVKSWLED